MQNSEINLLAISPIDGRYQSLTQALSNCCSEFGLMRFRIEVEIKWLMALANSREVPEVPAFDSKTIQFLTDIVERFSVEDAHQIKDLEKTTNHDVKAIEYYLKKRLEAHPKLKKISEFIHFACTSEDINNLSYALMLKETRDKHLLPILETLLAQLLEIAKQHASVPMLARTHGQIATPTTVGKEFKNVAMRLTRQIEILKKVPLLGKMNGAVGNYNAHVAAYPTVDWRAITKTLIENMGLVQNPYTTQIEPHDFMAEFFDGCSRINTILIDFNRDSWGYIALGIFKQKALAHETGSSTMPHKVNPIDFENAEGNLGVANALFHHLSAKLPISRWQRDLSDSTVLRNMGVPFAHSLIAYQSCLKGLSKIEVNREHLQKELREAWEVLAEPIQTLLRKWGISTPYEQLKTLTRGKTITESTLHAFINELPITPDQKSELKSLKPETYLGLAVQLSVN